MTCLKCGGSGLIPSKVLGKFSGKPIPNCWTHCECYEEEPEHCHELTPDDYDFPMSYSFRSYIEERTTGKPLPAIESQQAPVHQPESRPVVNVSYRIQGKSGYMDGLPAIKAIREELHKIRGQLRQPRPKGLPSKYL